MDLVVASCESISSGTFLFVVFIGKFQTMTVNDSLPWMGHKLWLITNESWCNDMSKTVLETSKRTFAKRIEITRWRSIEDFHFILAWFHLDGWFASTRSVSRYVIFVSDWYFSCRNYDKYMCYKNSIILNELTFVTVIKQVSHYIIKDFWSLTERNNDSCSFFIFRKYMYLTLYGIWTKTVEKVCSLSGKFNRSNRPERSYRIINHDS